MKQTEKRQRAIARDIADDESATGAEQGGQASCPLDGRWREELQLVEARRRADLAVAAWANLSFEAARSGRKDDRHQADLAYVSSGIASDAWRAAHAQSADAIRADREAAEWRAARVDGRLA